MSTQSPARTGAGLPLALTALLTSGCAVLHRGRTV